MNARRKLLVVSPVPVWPTDNGYALRVAGVLPHLCTSWQVALVAPIHAGVECPPWGFAHVARVDLQARWTYLPWQYETAPFRAEVSKLVRAFQPEVALLFGGAEYLGFDDPGFPPAVADHIDCLALGVLSDIRQATGLRELAQLVGELVRVTRYERRVVTQMRTTVLVGERDAAAIRRLGPGRQVVSIPNGADAAEEPAWNRASATPTVVFTGVLDYPPNLDAARWLLREIWPRLLSRVPAARLRIIGRRPTAALIAEAVHPSTAVVADVPDMRAELVSAWVAVAPMRGGTGVKNKVLEAWAVGRPVVMTPLACNGLALPEPLESLVGNEPDQIAALLARLLTVDAERHSLGAAALEHVRKHHAWRDVAERISALLLRAVDGSAP